VSFPANFSALPSGVFTGCVPCTGAEEVIMVDPVNKYARFDLIGIGQLCMVFSIDEHQMSVVAIDGRWVSPTAADAITICSGQRYSVVVRLDRPAGHYTIRSVSGDLAQIIQGSGMLSYTGAGPKHYSSSTSKPFVTLGGTNATADTIFLNESMATPFPPVQPSSSIDATFVLNIDNAGKAWKWRLGNTSFPIELEEDNPLLFNPTPKGNLTIANQNGSWIDLVVQPVAVNSPAHPIHKHSNKFFVVGQGVGVWNFSTVAQAAAVLPSEFFNFVDPPIRDTFPTQVALGMPTWLVLRYQSINPGAFLLHCHIQDHLYGGMALALLDGVDKFPDVPDEYRFGNGFQNCIAKT
jgi:FtsP/CotA-like multicopper oxidase with cupredoxin domain